MKMCALETADIAVDYQGYLLSNLQEWERFTQLDSLTGIRWIKDKWTLREKLDRSLVKTKRVWIPRRRPYPLFDELV